MRRRLSVLALAAVATTSGAFAASTAHAESTTSAFGSRLVSLINDARAQHGLRALTVASGTSTVAINWTNHLADNRALSHNPNLGAQLESHGSPNWTTYGENVGDGPASSADSLFNAYMNSPEHRANILGSAYRYVGVGVVFTGSTAWNTLDFVDQYSSGTTTSKPRTASPPKSTPTAAPKPTATATHRTVASAPQRIVVRAVHVAPKPAVKPHPVAKPVRHAGAVKPAAAAAPVRAAAPVALPAAPVAATSVVTLHHHGSRPVLPVLVAAALIALLMVGIPRAAARRA